MTHHHTLRLGSLAFLGSGETSLAGGRIFEHLAQHLSPAPRIAILETPAGFELNSAQVAGRVADYLRTRLQNYKPQIEVVPARKKNTSFSPDDPEICAPLLRADLIFMGPGSPTYAVRQLEGTLAWDIIRARHRLGATLVFASAATIAVGASALPVYEIYKVGQDVQVVPGLNLFKDFGASLAFIPHWNNAEGGEDLDTSRCFVGLERFTEWCALLPEGQTTVGLDEHTGLVINFQKHECRVMGVSSVTLVRECNPEIYSTGAAFPLNDLGDFNLDALERGINPEVWDLVNAAPPPVEMDETPSPEIVELARLRQQARLNKDWSGADEYRRKIAALGWVVQDTPEGPKLSKV
jgi:cyanophycinase-like exopeptidase